MDRKQYMTHCKYCGKLIVMTRNTETGRFTPCDPTIQWILSGIGDDVFINFDGQIVHGKISNGTAEPAYKKHSLSCKGRKSA